VRFPIVCCLCVSLAACGGLSQQAQPPGASARTEHRPSVEGTTWAWSEGRSVQFLSGGRVRFSNYAYGGYWQQHGDSVTFDQNGVMLFDVVIAGNAMSGTWRKLKGDDTRSTFPTNLKKTD
jgi:hypothetical protein